MIWRGAAILALLASPALAGAPQLDPQGCVHVAVQLGEEEIWASLQNSAGEPYCPQASAPLPQGAARFVQIGAFEQPQNVTRAVKALEAAGLPVLRHALTKEGRQLEAVSAGPFKDQASVEAALRRLKSAGFVDAFLR